MRSLLRGARGSLHPILLREPSELLQCVSGQTLDGHVDMSVGQWSGIHPALGLKTLRRNERGLQIHLVQSSPVLVNGTITCLAEHVS